MNKKLLDDLLGIKKLKSGDVLKILRKQADKLRQESIEHSTALYKSKDKPVVVLR